MGLRDVTPLHASSYPTSCLYMFPRVWDLHDSGWCSIEERLQQIAEKETSIQERMVGLERKEKAHNSKKVGSKNSPSRTGRTLKIFFVPFMQWF